MAVPVAPAEGGGPCSALPILEGADPKPLTFEVQPHRGQTADRDQPLGAVDLATTLGAGSVGGDAVSGPAYGPVLGGGVDEIRPPGPARDRRPALTSADSVAR